eukprot:7550625-Lingulodinium_polyedra.AAC.1
MMLRFSTSGNDAIMPSSSNWQQPVVTVQGGGKRQQGRLASLGRAAATRAYRSRARATTI